MKAIYYQAPAIETLDLVVKLMPLIAAGSTIQAADLIERHTHEVLSSYLKDSMFAFFHEQAAWSQQAFGLDSERGPIGPLKHLAKEAAEAMAKPDDLMEYVDCLFLTFDAARRAGFGYEQIKDAAWLKLEINKQRKWNVPKNSNEPVEHDRSTDSTPS